MTAFAPSPPAKAIVIVGHVCIDENTGTEGAADAGSQIAGSPAFFMTRQLRAIEGHEVAVIAPYGADFVALGGALPLVNAPGDISTLLYRNHIRGDERSQECLYSETALPVALDSTTELELERADVVVVSPLLPNFTPDYIDELFHSISADALTVLLVQGYLRTVDSDASVHQRAFTEFEAIVPRFDVAIFSDEDIDDALAVGALWSSRFPATTIIVTQNRHGATVFERGVGTSIAAAPLQTPGQPNVIGAGDVFSAEFTAAYERTRDLRRSVEAAHRQTAAFIDAAYARTAALN